ncbi:hypothetical protein GW17_00011571 [Ensete ventricosum]|uniref:Neprosin PEP catalytic domain-containing protein n=1 Tax=Ensete ventricosum TaxID=4639 RepID=A0A444FNE9_ENSVE|nr:hypothetical protein B296_00004503 [Ensete ventricosum]RWW24149.1 hypothetical protein GW17_00011571 [Ensete ventricosum]
MAANTCGRPILIPSAVSLVLLLLLAATAPAISSSEGRTLRERLNKRSMKTVQDPPERPRCHTGDGMADDVVQLWTASGETCPEGTVPIRRTKEEDILRIKRFGRKPFARAPQSTNVIRNRVCRGRTILRCTRIVQCLGSSSGQPRATMVEFGGEIVNTRPSGFHTATQMGSGHLAEEGFGRAAYIRSIRVVDPNDTLIPARNLSYYAEAPNCYDVQGGVDDSGESFFYFGGPGRNARCP